MIKNITLKIQVFFLIYIATIFQLKGLTILGTYWDDTGYIETIPIIFETIYIFFTDFNNPYLGFFNYNLEFYGYLFPLIVNLIEKSNLFTSLIEHILVNLYSYEIINELDLNTIIRFHIFNILMAGLLYYLYKTNKKFYGSTYSNVFLILLLLIPSFNGHLYFNIKDIPFAIIFYLTSLVLLNNANLIFQKTFEIKKYIIFLSILFSTLLLIRINAILFLIFLSFCLLILSKNNKKFYILNMSIVFGLSFIFTFILTPSAWRYPKIWIIKAIETQFVLSDWNGAVLTNGKVLDAQNLPSTYLVEWFFYKLPINILIVFFISVIYFALRNKNLDYLTKFSFLFIIAIFIFFSVFTPLAYDGIRQYLFLIPFIVHLNSIFIIKTFYFKNNVFFKLAFVFSIIYMIYSQASIHPFSYVYFNEFSDEDKITETCEKLSGCGEWDTDYWGLSGKSLILETKNIVKEDIQFTSCRPENVFLNYLNKSEVDNTQKEVYVSSIHRPAESFWLCNRTVPAETAINPETKCEFLYSKYIFLRNKKINLSYLYKCKI